MANFDHPPLYAKIAVLHALLIAEKHFVGAISLGVIAHNIARETKDQMLEDLSHAWMSTGLSIWKGDDSHQQGDSAEREPACSFCGRKPPEIRLAAGAKAFICDSCVLTLGEAFDRG